MRVYLLSSLSLWDFLVQDSPPPSGSDLGSVEDAADYHLRQQLRAAAAELKACQEERDRAIAAAAQASAERDRAVVVASRNADAMQAMRRKIRANAAADRRRMLRIDRPERGVFDLTPDYAVPLNISQRGALEMQVMSTDSISKEGRPRLAAEHLRDRVQKKARLLGAADTRLQYDTTKRRTNTEGRFIGGVEFCAKNKVEAFRRFSAPGFKSHATVGSEPATVAMGATSVTVRFRGFGRNKTRKTVDLRNPTPINAVGANSPQTVLRDILSVQLAVGKKIVQDRAVESADLVHLQVDSSTFGRYNMQAVLLTLMYIMWTAFDALGTPMCHVIMKSCCLDSLPCADKQAKDVFRNGVLVKYRKEAAFNFGLQLLMAGIAAVLLAHDCVVLGLDRGPEAVGAGKGQKWAARRDAFCGRGGYLEQVWGTREALEQPVESAEYGPMLVLLMTFMGVSQEDQTFETRLAPITMDTEAPVFRVPMNFVCLTRETDTVDKSKKIIISRQASVLNETNPKISTETHPLRKYPMYLGGSADAEWCDKHAMAVAVKMTTNPMKAFFREEMRIIRLLRNTHIWIALSTQASAILEAKGCRELDDIDLELIAAIGPERLEEMKRNNPAGLKLPVEACVTRWGLLYGGVAEHCANLLLFSALFPLALAEGTHENKIVAMQAVCSVGGFVDEGKIAYANPRVGRAVYYMSQPDHILRSRIVQFNNRFVWQPLLAACAHNKECAMTKLRGLGSLVLVVLWFLKRGIWAALPARKHKTWRMHLQLGHRGPSQVELVKVSGLFLSSRLENEWAWRNKPPGYVSDGPAAQKMSPLQHLYGEFYTPDMEHGISELQKAIADVGRMNLVANEKEPFTMLPAELRSSFWGWNSEKPEMPKQSSYWFRIQQAMWLVHHDTCAAADAVTAKYRLQLCDPQGFYAGMTGVDAHRLLLGDFEIDGAGTVGTFYTATVLARANAAVLSLQARELLARDSNVADHLQSPLKQLFSPQGLDELDKFSSGAAVRVDLERRGTLLSDEDGTKPDVSTLYYPVNKFKILAKGSMLAAARPTSNNPIESRWSILTGKYMSGMRNAKGLCLSQYAKQPDFHTFQMKEWMIMPSFLALVVVAYKFVMDHFESISRFFDARQDDSQQKMKDLREDSAKETFTNTNIRPNKTTAKSKSKDNKQPARAERRAQPRNKSNQLSGSSGSEEDDSDNTWSADNSESEEGIPECIGDSDDDAFIESPPAAAQKKKGKAQRPEQPVEVPNSRVTRSKSAETIPSSADAAVGSIVAPSRVPSSNSNSSSGNGGEIPALADPVAPPPQGGIADDLSLRASACNDETGCASEDTSPKEPIENNEVCDWTIHPVELKSELDETSAQRLSPYRLSYTRWMLKSRKWQRTTVEFVQKSRGDHISVANLTRCDGVKFHLVAKTSVFYVLHTPMGLELISVQSMAISEGNNSNLVVRFNRVLSTKRAAQAAFSRDDLVSTLKSTDFGGRSIISTRLGSDSLTRLLISQQKSPTVVHEGDIAYTDFAYNIVGVVGTLTPNATDKEDKQALLRKLRANQSINFAQARDISCFDVVIHGPHFSDTAPPKSQGETGYARRSIFLILHEIVFFFFMSPPCLPGEAEGKKGICRP